MSNRFFITLLVIIAGVCGFIVYNNQKKSDDGANVASTVQASDHVKGSDSSGVVLVEYGDFQCPACGSYYPIVKQVYEQYKGQITFQFRNFPLVQIHPNAMLAHRAAEAAGKQGKFWEMHDKLYETQQSWSATTSAATVFESYAQQLGLDMEKYKADAASQAINDVINADIREAQKIGASSTPTFVLDGVKIQNPRTVEDFAKVIDEAIAKKSQQ